MRRARNNRHPRGLQTLIQARPGTNRHTGNSDTPARQLLPLAFQARFANRLAQDLNTYIGAFSHFRRDRLNQNRFTAIKPHDAALAGNHCADEAATMDTAGTDLIAGALDLGFDDAAFLHERRTRFANTFLIQPMQAGRTFSHRQSPPRAAGPAFRKGEGRSRPTGYRSWCGSARPRCLEWHSRPLCHAIRRRRDRHQSRRGAAA